MPKSTSRKTTKKVSAERLKEVIEMLAMGCYYSEITYNLSLKWGTSIRNVERYLTKAYSTMSLEFSKEEKEQVLAKYNLLYRKSLEIKDYRSAKHALDSIARIGGLFKDKLDVSITEYKAKFGRKE